MAVLEADLRLRHEQLHAVARPDLDDDPTPSPLQALKMYAGSGNALRLNRYLRGQRSAQGETLRRMHEGMLVFFEDHARVLDAALTMRRWVFTHGDYSPALLTPRTTITEQGWSSLTLNSVHGFFSTRADVEYAITLPVGARVLSASLPEREFILRPDSTFRVSDVVASNEEVGGKPKYLLRLDLL